MRNKLSTIKSYIEERMEYFDHIFDYLSKKILEDFQKIYIKTEEMIKIYLEEPVEEGGNINLNALKRYQVAHFALFEEYFTKNRYLDNLTIMLMCYGSCWSVVSRKIKNYYSTHIDNLKNLSTKCMSNRVSYI